MSELISIQDALTSLLRHPVLVLGPAATAPLIGADMQTKLTEIVGLEESACQKSFGDIIDEVRLKAADKYQSIRQEILTHVKGLPPSPAVYLLASGKWSGVVSLVGDALFETALQERLDRVPTSLTITVIDHPGTIPPPHTIPVFKLMGSIADHRAGHALALSTSEYLSRKQSWPRLLASLPDVARNAPLFFIGTQTCIDVVRDFISALFGAQPPYPSKLLFLKGDGTAHDSTVQALVAGHCAITIIDASLKEFCEGSAGTDQRLCWSRCGRRLTRMRWILSHRLQFLPNEVANLFF